MSGLDIVVPPSIHKSRINQGYVSDSPSDKRSSENSSRTESHRSSLSSLRSKSLFTLRSRKQDTKSKGDSRKHSLFSLETLSSSKNSIVPNNHEEEEDKY